MKWAQLLETIDSNINFSFSRSAGSGGQNVNKVNTKVTARLPLCALTILDQRQIEMLTKRLAGRLNADREIVVHVQDERSQRRNREIAVARLRALVVQALAEKKHRRSTRPSLRSRRERLEAKRRRSATKSNRKRVDPSDLT